MSLADVTDKDFEEKVVKSEKPVVVDLNVDENPMQTQKFLIMSIPTTILFKDGKEHFRQIGFAGKGAFEDLIKKGL
jgi:thioredoxin 1